MINAIVYYGENTLILELPRSIYDIHEKLLSIGCCDNPYRAKLTDNEGDDLRIKLYGRIEMGNHLIRLLSEQNTLCCVFHPTPYSEFSLGQEAFNRYAESIGDPVTDRYGLFTHGSGYEWEYVFRKAFEDDPRMDKITFDCEAGGFFCYGESVDLMADLGHRFREMLDDTESFTELVCKAIPEGRQREAELQQLRSTVKGFLMEHPNATVDLMTPGGYVHLTPERGKALLEGIPVPAHPGVSGCERLVDAEEILDQHICACNQDCADGNHYAMITEPPVEESEDIGMTM